MFTPVFEAINGLMLNCASTSSHNPWPPPKSIHAHSSSAVKPYGTEVKKFSAGDLAPEVVVGRMVHVGDACSDRIEDFERADESIGRVDPDLELPVRHYGDRLRQSLGTGLQAGRVLRPSRYHLEFANVLRDCGRRKAQTCTGSD